MAISFEKKTALLLSIKNRFQAIRELNGGTLGKCTVATKVFALSAMNHGATPVEVAEAVGVTRRCITYWIKESRGVPGSTEAVQLKLVRRRKSLPTPLRPSEKFSQFCVARIIFGSGVILELSHSALSADLISTLNSKIPTNTL